MGPGEFVIGELIEDPQAVGLELRGGERRDRLHGNASSWSAINGQMAMIKPAASAALTLEVGATRASSPC
jgi:hypothetical protein